MDLDHLLARARGYEERAAAAYRGFAARTRAEPELCALWTALARDEDQHAAALTSAARWLDPTEGWYTHLDGWDEALAEIEARLADAERIDVGADVDRQLLAALALERSELDTLYQRLLGVTHAGEPAAPPVAHVERLVRAAEQRSTNPALQLEAALFRAHTRLRRAS